jgi:hypothetical protein
MFKNERFSWKYLEIKKEKSEYCKKVKGIYAAYRVLLEENYSTRD